jgi:hypothetical protein
MRLSTGLGRLEVDMKGESMRCRECGAEMKVRLGMYECTQCDFSMPLEQSDREPSASSTSPHAALTFNHQEPWYNSVGRAKRDHSKTVHRDVLDAAMRDDPARGTPPR